MAFSSFPTTSLGPPLHFDASRYPQGAVWQKIKNSRFFFHIFSHTILQPVTLAGAFSFKELGAMFCHLCWFLCIAMLFLGKRGEIMRKRKKFIQSKQGHAPGWKSDLYPWRFVANVQVVAVAATVVPSTVSLSLLLSPLSLLSYCF